jgi:hypothetical protein
MTESERKAHGISAGKKKSVFRSVVFPAVRTFPLQDQPDRQPRDADTGIDPSGDRAYSDAVLERLGGGTGGHKSDSPSPIPNAGAGPTREHDSRGVPNSGFRPMPGGEGDAGHIVDDHGQMTVDPNFGAGTGAYTNRQIGELDGVMVKVGPNWLMRNVDPGIAQVAPFAEPGPRTDVLKMKKAKPGMFRRVGDSDFGSLGR